MSHEAKNHSIVPSQPTEMHLTHTHGQDRTLFVSALIDAGRRADEEHSSDVFAEYHATCQPNTLKRHYYDLRCLCEFLLEQQQVSLTPQQLALSAESWRGMSYGLVADFRAWMLQRGFSLGTINNRLATVRQYCRLAGPSPKGADVLTSDAMTAILTISGYNGKVARNVDRHRTSNEVPTRIGYKKADFTRISKKEMVQLQKMTTPPPPPTRIQRDHDQLLQARDAVMWSLLDEHLLRVSELISLNIESIDLEEKTITVYREKGDETWIYEMGPLTEANIRIYFKQLGEMGRENGPLFLGYGGKRMTTSAINKRVGILGAQLGFGSKTSENKIKGKPRQRLSPHDLRHHAAIELLNEGTPLNELQALGGWRTAHMPLQYAKVSKDAIIRSPKRKMNEYEKDE